MNGIIGTQGKKQGGAAHGKHKDKVAGKHKAHREGKPGADELEVSAVPAA